MSADEQSVDSDIREILEVRHDYLVKFNEGDIDGVCATFTEDVVAIPPDEEAFVGREALAEHYRVMYEELGGDARIEQDPVARVEVAGDTAYSVGSYTFYWKEDGETVSAYGRSVEVWRRERDGWKMYIDMWNSLPEGVQKKRGEI